MGGSLCRARGAVSAAHRWTACGRMRVDGESAAAERGEQSMWMPVDGGSARGQLASATKADPGELPTGLGAAIHKA